MNKFYAWKKDVEVRVEVKNYVKLEKSNIIKTWRQMSLRSKSLLQFTKNFLIWKSHLWNYYYLICCFILSSDRKKRFIYHFDLRKLGKNQRLLAQIGNNRQKL